MCSEVSPEVSSYGEEDHIRDIIESRGYNRKDKSNRKRGRENTSNKPSFEIGHPEEKSMECLKQY